MTDRSSKIKAHERERLEALIEHSSVIASVAAKALREGFESAAFDDDDRCELQFRMTKLLFVIDMMVKAGDVSGRDIQAGRVDQQRIAYDEFPHNHVTLMKMRIRDPDFAEKLDAVRTEIINRDLASLRAMR